MDFQGIHQWSIWQWELSGLVSQRFFFFLNSLAIIIAGKE